MLFLTSFVDLAFGVAFFLAFNFLSGISLGIGGKHNGFMERWVDRRCADVQKSKITVGDMDWINGVCKIIGGSIFWIKGIGDKFFCK